MKEGFHIKPITKTEAMYLKEHNLSVQKAVHCKSYYVIEEDDEFLREGDDIFSKLLEELEEKGNLDDKLFKVVRNKFGKIDGIIKYGALVALNNYRKSVTVYSYFKKAK